MIIFEMFLQLVASTCATLREHMFQDLKVDSNQANEPK